MNFLGGLFVWEMSGDLMENLVRLIKFPDYYFNLEDSHN